MDASKRREDIDPCVSALREIVEMWTHERLTHGGIDATYLERELFAKARAALAIHDAKDKKA